MSSCISHRHQLSFRTHFSHISSHPLLVTADIGTRRPRMAGGMLLWVRYRTLPYFILINNALLHCACRPLLTNDIHKCSTTLVFLLFVDHFLTTKFSNTHQAMLYLVMFVDRHFLLFLTNKTFQSQFYLLDSFMKQWSWLLLQLHWTRTRFSRI